MLEFEIFSDKMSKILNLSGFPVGVDFLSGTDNIPAGSQKLERHRYCQALMRARRGQPVILDGDRIACPAAAAAFGFRPLPANLQNGKGLVGFGIVQEEAAGGG